MSRLRIVFSSPTCVGTKPLNETELCRTLKIVSPFLPQPGSFVPLNTPGQLIGIVDGRSVEFHCGSTFFVS